MARARADLWHSLRLNPVHEDRATALQLYEVHGPGLAKNGGNPGHVFRKTSHGDRVGREGVDSKKELRGARLARFRNSFFRLLGHGNDGSGRLGFRSALLKNAFADRRE
jgi:hypothetical protein